MRARQEIVPILFSDSNNHLARINKTFFIIRIEQVWDAVHGKEVIVRPSFFFFFISWTAPRFPHAGCVCCLLLQRRAQHRPWKSCSSLGRAVFYTSRIELSSLITGGRASSEISFTVRVLRAILTTIYNNCEASRTLRRSLRRSLLTAFEGVNRIQQN